MPLVGTKLSQFPSSAYNPSTDIIIGVRSTGPTDYKLTGIPSVAATNTWSALNTFNGGAYFNNGSFDFNGHGGIIPTSPFPYTTGMAWVAEDGSGRAQFSCFSQSFSGGDYWNFLLSDGSSGALISRVAFGVDGTSAFQVGSNSVLICGGEGGGYGNVYCRAADDPTYQGFEIGDGLGGLLNVLGGTVTVNNNRTVPNSATYFLVYDNNANIAFQVDNHSQAGGAKTLFNTLDDSTGAAWFVGHVAVGTSTAAAPYSFTIGDVNADTLVFIADGGNQLFQIGDISKVNYGNILDINSNPGYLDYSISGGSAFSVNTSGVMSITNLSALISPTWRPLSDSTNALTIMNSIQTYTMVGFDTTNGRISVGTSAASALGAFDVVGKNSVLTSGNSSYLNVFPFINQAGTAGYRAFWVSVRENAVGSGSNLLADLGTNTGSHGSGTHTSKFSVDHSGNGIFIGNVTLSTAGSGLVVKSGTNARIGTGTLSGGTLTVANTSVTTNTRVFLTDTGTSVTNVGSLTAVTTAGTGFVVTSTSPLDTSTFNWLLIESQ